MPRLTILLIIAALPLSALGQRMTRQQYIDKYKSWAISEMKRTGIPASITLAQGILESDCGNSPLATSGNNHFGIKCHNDWNGERYYQDDDKKNECFRVYESAYQSFVDHSDFLTSKSRYSSLFNLKSTDYEGWAKGLKNAGYATDPNYATRLINIIEEMGLSAFDNNNNKGSSSTDKSQKSISYTDVADLFTDDSGESKTTPRVKRTFAIDPFPAHEVLYNNGVKVIEVNGSDSFQSIAREFHMMVWELLKYNDLDQGADISKIRYLYLRTKRNRAHRDCETHIVKTGDTAWSIAHKYGIKLRKLRKFNHLTEGEEPHVGDVLNLRHTK